MLSSISALLLLSSASAETLTFKFYETSSCTEIVQGWQATSSSFVVEAGTCAKTPGYELNWMYVMYSSSDNVVEWYKDQDVGTPCLDDINIVIQETCKSDGTQCCPWNPPEESAKYYTITTSDTSDTSDKSDDPCFSRDTYAIGADGESIPMASLKSGDLVKDGPHSVARVIVNQHRAVSLKSSLLEIDHANGAVSLTPDHVLEVDGAFVPARFVSAGSKLGESEVSRVTAKAGEVINPLTTSGKILTQGGVLATTYPEWVAEYMLSSYLVPLPLSLSNLISYLFPETAQAYYDALIEPLVTKAHPKHLKAALPAVLYPAAFLAGDLAVSAGFLGFALTSPVVFLAIAAAVATKARK